MSLVSSISPRSLLGNSRNKARGLVGFLRTFVPGYVYHAARSLRETISPLHLLIDVYSKSLTSVLSPVEKLMPEVSFLNILLSGDHGDRSWLNTFTAGSIYCATKHAVSAFNGSLLRELVNTPIRVCEIQPGERISD